MDQKRKNLDNLLRCVLGTEDRYLKSDIDRKLLEENIKYLRHEYKKFCSSNNFIDSTYYKIMIQLVLERLKQTIIFEDKLVNMVDNVYDSFNKNLNEFLNEPILPDDPDLCSSTQEVEEKPQPKKSLRRANYPYKVTQILKKWLEENVNHPYPTEFQKIIFCDKTGLEVSQINNWFINARRRILPLMKNSNGKL